MCVPIHTTAYQDKKWKMISKMFWYDVHTVKFAELDLDPVLAS